MQLEATDMSTPRSDLLTALAMRPHPLETERLQVAQRETESTADALDLREIAVGSRWRHRNGRPYTVYCLANVDSVNPDYPVTVVYIGVNGKLWAKTADSFLSTMTPDRAAEA